jgi:hypothetical protein
VKRFSSILDRVERIASGRATRRFVMHPSVQPQHRESPARGEGRFGTRPASPDEAACANGKGRPARSEKANDIRAVAFAHSEVLNVLIRSWAIWPKAAEATSLWNRKS